MFINYLIVPNLFMDDDDSYMEQRETRSYFRVIGGLLAYENSGIPTL